MAPWNPPCGLTESIEGLCLLVFAADLSVKVRGLHGHVSADAQPVAPFLPARGSPEQGPAPPGQGCASKWMLGQLLSPPDSERGLAGPLGVAKGPAGSPWGDTLT